MTLSKITSLETTVNNPTTGVVATSSALDVLETKVGYSYLPNSGNRLFDNSGACKKFDRCYCLQHSNGYCQAMQIMSLGKTVWAQRKCQHAFRLMTAQALFKVRTTSTNYSRNKRFIFAVFGEDKCLGMLQVWFGLVAQQRVINFRIYCSR